MHGVAPLRGARSGFRAALATALLTALAATACGSAAPAIRESRPVVSYAGTQLPAPVAPERGPEQPPAVPDPADAPPPPPTPTRHSADASSAPAYSEALRNAGRRDEETERLTRHYLSLLSTMAQVAAARAAHQSAENYDPVPVMRLHAQVAPELGSMVARASLLAGHWAAVAQQLGLPLPPAAGSSGTDREGRLRLLVATCACIRDDASDRMAQGAVWQAAHDAGLDDAAIRKREGTPQRYLADMEQLARTVDCSQRALEVLRRR